jgi:hypothetical protein
MWPYNDKVVILAQSYDRFKICFLLLVPYLFCGLFVVLTTQLLSYSVYEAFLLGMR